MSKGGVVGCVFTGSSKPSVPQASTPPQQEQGQEQGLGPAAASGYRTSIMQSMYGGKFRSSFQSSGTAHGDMHAKATVVMPKRASAAQLPPAPTPISQVDPLLFPHASSLSCVPSLVGGIGFHDCVHCAHCCTQRLDRVSHRGDIAPYLCSCHHT